MSGTRLMDIQFEVVLTRFPIDCRLILVFAHSTKISLHSGARYPSLCREVLVTYKMELICYVTVIRELQAIENMQLIDG
jgi:hypothetical protein